jgi:circadian clock protein KaiB
MKQLADFKFRLYVAGDTHNSAQARVNLRALCDTYIPERYVIEEIDVLRHPNRALIDGIFITPALIKLAPGGSRMIVGTLSETNAVLVALGIDASAP